MVIGVIKDHKSRQSASMILMPLYLEGKWEKFHMKVSKNLEQNTTLIKYHYKLELETNLRKV